MNVLILIMRKFACINVCYSICNSGLYILHILLHGWNIVWRYCKCSVPPMFDWWRAFRNTHVCVFVCQITTLRNSHVVEFRTRITLLHILKFKQKYHTKIMAFTNASFVRIPSQILDIKLILCDHNESNSRTMVFYILIFSFCYYSNRVCC